MTVLWIVLSVAVVALIIVAVTIAPGMWRGRRDAGRRQGADRRDRARPIGAERPAPSGQTDKAGPAATATAGTAAQTPTDTVARPATAPAPAPVPEERPVPPVQLRDRLTKTRGLFSGYVKGLRSRGSVDEQAWEDLEEALLRADVGVATTTSLLDDLRTRVRKGELRGPDAVLEALRLDMKESLDSANGSRSLGRQGERQTQEEGARPIHDAVDPEPATARAAPSEDEVEVWLFVGVNGVGKTTTIGKVARNAVRSGRSVLLAAGDTFRAAAAEQLTTWAERAGVEIVSGAEGADPSAVVFDAVRRAAARGNDLVLADTAGRVHTKVNLIEELKKIRRVADRDPGNVTEVLLVLDATTGQNGLVQAKQFTEAVGVTGVVLTKLDGTAKGGVVLAIRAELGLPIKLVGVGEAAADLLPFDPAEFVAALFG